MDSTALADITLALGEGAERTASKLSGPVSGITGAWSLRMSSTNFCCRYCGRLQCCVEPNRRAERCRPADPRREEACCVHRAPAACVTTPEEHSWAGH